MLGSFGKIMSYLEILQFLVHFWQFLSNFGNLMMFLRPGVARAVRQTHLLLINQSGYWHQALKKGNGFLPIHQTPPS